MQAGVGCVMLGWTPLQGAGESINELAESGTAVTGVDYLRSTRFAAGLVCVTLADRWYSWGKKCVCYMRLRCSVTAPENTLPAAHPSLMCRELSLQLGQRY